MLNRETELNTKRSELSVIQRTSNNPQNQRILIPTSSGRQSNTSLSSLTQRHYSKDKTSLILALEAEKCFQMK